MHIDSFYRVETLISERLDIVTSINSLRETKGNNWLGVTFQGKYQDSDICDSVRPILIERMNFRLNTVNQALKSLGVDTE